MLIKTFANAQTRELFETGVNRRWSGIARIAVRKLTQIDVAEKLSDLNCPPGNCLEALRGDREGQHSIRINERWRICFRWSTDGVYDVEIVDYH